MSKKSKHSNQNFQSQIKEVFEKRFLEMLDNNKKEYEKFIQTILTPQKKSIRISENVDEKLLINQIKEKGFFLEKVPFIKKAYFLNHQKSQRSDLGNLIEHFFGEIYVQEITSMIPALFLEIPKKIDTNFRILDIAAAPGSKTTQIAQMMGNKGILVANEIDYSRLSALKINLERCSFSNIIITNQDGRRIKGDEIYDRILLDVPCSGSGIIRKSPKTLKYYNPKKLKAITNLQLKLLKKGFELLKNKGILIYSTCSLDPEENELLIQKFLEKNKNAKIQKIELKNLILNNRLEKFFDKIISKEVYENAIRIWPQSNDTNGFFLCKIKKEENE